VVILLEAPLSELHAEQLMKSVDELAPDRPISHVVQSHHHVDHASGARQVVGATGADLVFGNGVEQFWKTVLSAPSVIRPDALEETGMSGALVTVNEAGSLVLVDEADVVVTVYHSTRSEHSADILLASIETDGMMYVFENDMYNPAFGEIEVVLDGPQVLFDIMRDVGILDENCMSFMPVSIIPGHGSVQTLEEVLANLDGRGFDVGC
jgi:glyoxylase-like metal-dependent hydrolase (beta-lactamase superfamily II)